MSKVPLENPNSFKLEQTSVKHVGNLSTRGRGIRWADFNCRASKMGTKLNESRRGDRSQVQGSCSTRSLVTFPSEPVLQARALEMVSWLNTAVRLNRLDESHIFKAPQTHYEGTVSEQGCWGLPGYTARPNFSFLVPPPPPPPLKKT